MNSVSIFNLKIYQRNWVFLLGQIIAQPDKDITTERIEKKEMRKLHKDILYKHRCKNNKILANLIQQYA